MGAELSPCGAHGFAYYFPTEFDAQWEMSSRGASRFLGGGTLLTRRKTSRDTPLLTPKICAVNAGESTVTLCVDALRAVRG